MGEDQPEDPFDGLVLDEAFVAGARRREPSAADRAAPTRTPGRARSELEAGTRRAASPPRARDGRNRRRLVRSIAIYGVLGAVLVFVVTGLGSSSGLVARLGIGGARPSPTAGNPTPLGYPSTNGEVGNHSFMAFGPDGEPARYDPCREIHIVVNERRIIPDGDFLLRAALDDISDATGLQFVIEGTTDEPPSADREPFQPERYGDRWAPVLIAWSDHTETARLGPEAAGLGGSDPIVVDGHAVYVTGTITLDGAWMQAKGNYGGGYATQAILTHELGHLVGLGHVSDPGQLMYEDNNGRRGLGSGDLAGLAELGRGPCIAEL